MIVGSLLTDTNSLKNYISSYDTYCEYCESLVPEEFRHIKSIVLNQRYYVTLLLRREDTISWEDKKELIAHVMKNVKVAGLTDAILEVSQVLKECNEQIILDYFRRDL